jgi:LacI family transcriptional regulator
MAVAGIGAEEFAKHLGMRRLVDADLAGGIDQRVAQPAAEDEQVEHMDQVARAGGLQREAERIHAAVAVGVVGLKLLRHAARDDPALKDEALRTARVLLADVVVLAGAVASPLLAWLSADGAPLLFVNRRSPCDAAAPFIGIDNAAAGAEVAQALADAGIRRVGVIHAALASSATAERVAGFRARATALGMALRVGLPRAADGAEHLRIGQRAATEMFARGARPQALFCLSDVIAYGAHRAAEAASIAVPQDLLVVGFDDNPLNDWVAPWLSSVAVPYGAIGDAVAGCVRSMADGTRDLAVLLPHRLIRRAGLAAVVDR